MNFTKEQRDKLCHDYMTYNLMGRGHVKLLIEDCDELENELAASRDKSAVPSEYELFKAGYVALRKMTTKIDFDEISEQYCLKLFESFKRGIDGNNN